MSRCTAQQTKRHQVAETPRQVISYVVLHRQPDTEDCGAPHGQWVALQNNRVLVAPETNSDQLWDAETLSRQRERCHVFMMDCMDASVKLWMLVMYEMPNIVLSVKKEKYSQSASEKLIQSWSILWHCWCRQDERADYYNWHNKEYVVRQRYNEVCNHHFHSWPPVWLDLVLIE